MPHKTPDAILAASDLIGQLNTIVSRRVPAGASAVLSVTQVEGGHAHNVMPASCKVTGTVRTFDPAIQDLVEAAIRQIAAGVALASGTEAQTVYDRYYPATINDPEATAEALAIAGSFAETQLAPEPAFTSEDFAFMLHHCKGAYLWLGQGSPTANVPLHHPGYDFNDQILETGIRLHVALVEEGLAASA